MLTLFVDWANLVHYSANPCSKLRYFSIIIFHWHEIIDCIVKSSDFVKLFITWQKRAELTFHTSIRFTVTENLFIYFHWLRCCEFYDYRKKIMQRCRSSPAHFCILTSLLATFARVTTRAIIYIFFFDVIQCSSDWQNSFKENNSSLNFLLIFYFSPV